MILGITGAFGSGKSACLAAFARHQWRTADADGLCHRLYDRRDATLTAAIVEHWGSGILQEDGSVDRRKLGEKVFQHPEELARLTALLYPSLLCELDAQIAACRHDGVNGAFELPLLYEGNFETRFDAVLAVWATPEIRRKRLNTLRGYDADEIRRREARQLSPELKLERADYALINNGTVGELNAQIDLFMKTMR